MSGNSLVIQGSGGSNRAIFYYNKHFLNQAKIQEHCVQSFSRKLFKLISVSLSMVARVPFAKIALDFAGKNLVFGYVLAGSNVISFGMLIAWSQFQMINAEFKPLMEEEKAFLNEQKSCLSRLVKPALFALGILSQTPGAYYAYVYNDKQLIYPILMLTCDSAIPIYSLFLTADAVGQKRKARRQKKIPGEEVKQQVVGAFKTMRKKFLKMNSKEKNEFIAAFEKVKRKSEEERVGESLELMLTQKSKEMSKMFCATKAFRYLLGGGGSIAATSWMTLLFTAGFYGTGLFWNNLYGQIGGGAFVTLCNLYLSFGAITKSPMQIFDFFRNLVVGEKTLAFQQKPVLASTLLLLCYTVSGFGFAPAAKISEDYYDGMLKEVMQVLSPIAAVFFVSSAMPYFVDNVIRSLMGFKLCGESKKEIEAFDASLGRMIEYFQNIKPEEIKEFVESLSSDLKKHFQKDSETMPLLRRDEKV